MRTTSTSAAALWGVGIIALFVGLIPPLAAARATGAHYYPPRTASSEVDDAHEEQEHERHGE